VSLHRSQPNPTTIYLNAYSCYRGLFWIPRRDPSVVQSGGGGNEGNKKRACQRVNILVIAHVARDRKTPPAQVNDH